MSRKWPGSRCGELRDSDLLQSDAWEVEYVARSIRSVVVYNARYGRHARRVVRSGEGMWVAAANLGAYYLVGLPAAIVFAFVYDLKGRGLWMGLIMGVTTQAFTLAVMAFATNWHEQAEEALIRVYSSVTATLPVEANDAQKDDIPALHLFKCGDLMDA